MRFTLKIIFIANKLIYLIGCIIFQLKLHQTTIPIQHLFGHLIGVMLHDLWAAVLIDILIYLIYNYHFELYHYISIITQLCYLQYTHLHWFFSLLHQFLPHITYNDFGLTFLTSASTSILLCLTWEKKKKKVFYGLIITLILKTLNTLALALLLYHISFDI